MTGFTSEHATFVVDERKTYERTAEDYAGGTPRSHTVRLEGPSVVVEWTVHPGMIPLNPSRPVTVTLTQEAPDQ